MIALDTETHPSIDGRCRCAECLCVPICAPPIVCLSWAVGDESGVVHRTEDWRAVVRTALRSVPIVGHHFSFDAAVVMAADASLIPDVFDAFEADRVTDTMLRQKLLDVATGERKWRHDAAGNATPALHSLAALVRLHLGHDAEGKEGPDVWRVRYNELHNIPLAQWPRAAYEYARLDAVHTLEVFRAQERLAPPDVFRDQFRQARASLWLTLSSAYGPLLDPNGVSAFERALIVERDGLGKALVDAGLMTWSAKGGFRKSTLRARDRMTVAYSAQGLDAPTADKGNVSLARTSCDDSHDDDLNAYSVYSQVSYVLSKDIEAYRKVCLQNGPPRAHSRIDTILETGRISYSKPALQNLSRKGLKSVDFDGGARECIIAPPGMVLLAVDFSGCELATFAQSCLDILGFSVMAEMLNSGIDPHLVIAEQIDPSARGYTWLKEHRKDPDVDDLRQVGKVANFGLPGGLGEETLVHYALQSYGVRLSRELATQVKAVWRRTLKEADPFFAVVARQVERGIVDLPRSGRIRGGVRFTSACNTWFQGPASDIMKAAGWVVSKETYDARCNSVLFGSRIVLCVHDEIVLEVPETHAADCARRVETLMVDAAKPWLPDVRIGVESTAMRRYSKKPKGSNVVAI